jgi:hypothetical protein
MFEAHKAKQAEQAYESLFAQWQRDRTSYAGFLEEAQSFRGVASSAILLGGDEAVFLEVGPAALIETRAGQGHYQGVSGGVSIPIGSVGGHPVRYRVGASRGH